MDPLIRLLLLLSCFFLASASALEIDSFPNAPSPSIPTSLLVERSQSERRRWPSDHHGGSESYAPRRRPRFRFEFDPSRAAFVPSKQQQWSWIDEQTDPNKSFFATSVHADVPSS